MSGGFHTRGLGDLGQRRLVGEGVHERRLADVGAPDDGQLGQAGRGALLQRRAALHELGGLDPRVTWRPSRRCAWRTADLRCYASVAHPSQCRMIRQSMLTSAAERGN